MNSNDYPVNMDEHVIGDKPKKHHFFRNLFIVLLVLIGLLLGGVGIFYACFFDSSRSELTLEKGITHEQVLSSAVVDSIEKTKEDKRIELKIDEEDLNYLLKETYDSSLLDDTVKNFITDFYVKVDGNLYDLNIKLELPLFETNLKVKTKAVEFKAKDKADDEIRFHITDIKVGRIGGFFDIGLSVLAKFVDMDMFNDIFKNVGLSIKVDLNKRLLTYKEADLFSDLKNLFKGKNDLLINLLDTFYQNDLVSFNFENSLGVYIDLSSLGEPNEKDLLSPSLTNSTLKLEKLLNENVIGQGDVNDMMYYLLRGYDKLNLRQKEIIDRLDLSSIDILDNTSYIGSNVPPSLNLGETITSTINSNSSDVIHKIINKQDVEIARITNSDFTKFLESTDVLGYSYPLVKKDFKTKNFKANYITISDVYSEMEDDLLKVYTNLNINGFIVKFNVEIIIQSSSFDKIVLKVVTSKMGDLDVTDEFNDYLFTLLETSFGSDPYFTFDKTNQLIYLNLNNLLNSINLNLGIPGYDKDMPLGDIFSDFHYLAEPSFNLGSGEEGYFKINLAI